MKKMHEDLDYVAKKYTISLKNKLKEAKETLQIFDHKGLIETSFPTLHFALNKMEILMIVFAVAITYINRNVGYTNICNIVGNKIIFNIYFNEFISIFPFYKGDNKNNKKIKDIHTFDEFIKLINLKKYDSLRLGDFYLDRVFMRYPTDIFQRDFNQKEGFLKHETVKLIINPKYFYEIKENPVIEPSSLPMVCKPIELSYSTFGGYLNNTHFQESLITGSTYHGHEMHNKTNLYKSINYMSSVQFNVNSSQYNYLMKDGKYLIEEIDESLINNEDDYKK
jgi:hypothetical protein